MYIMFIAVYCIVYTHICIQNKNYMCGVMQPDGNSLKSDTFRMAITSEIIISS